MEIRWDRVRTAFADAAVSAINASLMAGQERALKDVPVRQVFTGGRKTVRFKTAAEIERDRDLRSKLGLAPEILATPGRIAAVRAQGLNPKGSTNRGGQSFGFARTIEFPSRSTYRRKADGTTRADRGLTELRRNRANTFQPSGQDSRVIDPDKSLDKSNRLLDRSAEFGLSGRGRYELENGRAIQQRRVLTGVRTDIETGRITKQFQKVGEARIGGGLRSTIRIERPSASTYPVIEGRLLAGDREHDYAKYQELGTRHNVAHPFLRPRLMEWKQEFPGQLETALGRFGR